MFNFLGKKKLPDSQATLTLALTGLHCSSCAVNIDLSLEDLAGVVNSKTNYAKSVAVIDYEPEKIDSQKIIAEVEKLGYSAKLVS